MATEPRTTYQRRIYPLSPKELSEEQLAVVFAMTSRRPEPFDEIARQVSQAKAAEFHERWVLGYGHASVAEHAIIHMAVENISRLACDTLEDNRLASYTEKSSRFQVLPKDYYHVPYELDAHPDFKEVFIHTCDFLFTTYSIMIERLMSYLPGVRPRQEGEKDGAYRLRVRREVTDACRFLLPAATLTNVGVTMNARVMEHAIAKLLSSNLQEERTLGEELKQKGGEITPTLIKYAEVNQYLKSTRNNQTKLSQKQGSIPSEMEQHGVIHARLVHYDHEAEEQLVAGMLYRQSRASYEAAWQKAKAMSPSEREHVLAACLGGLGPHDAPIRETELLDYTFELVMDYGAYREWKRHRMQTYIPQPLTVDLGYTIPPVIVEGGQEGEFQKAMNVAAEGYKTLLTERPVENQAVAQYLVTHAHHRRLLSKMNLRECYQLFKLRTQPSAHFTIREVADKVMRLAVDTHPRLFKYLRLRQYPHWWPFPQLNSA